MKGSRAENSLIFIAVINSCYWPTRSRTIGNLGRSWPSPETFFTAYRERIVSLLAHPATRRNHTNVLMHVQGYFRPHLNASQKQELTSLIDEYRQGRQPLLAPVTLLKHYMAEFPDAYLAGQRYFSLWPDVMSERDEH